jgi:hypothetical protein
MLSEQTSGFTALAAAIRSSSVIVALPPVEMLMTASVDCLMRGRNCMKCSTAGLGDPSAGLRAWRCRIEAPASAAAIADSAISLGVIGRYGDMDGVWIDPVGAQVMMTFFAVRMGFPSP